MGSVRRRIREWRGWAIVLVLAVSAGIVTPPTGSVDAATCDLTWVRGGGTFGDADWDLATSWEPQRTPRSTDVVCLSSARVEFYLLTATVGAVDVASGGTLWLWGSTLDLTSTSSIAGILLVNGSTVRGAADLTIEKGRTAGNDTGQNGTFSTTGSGRLVVDGQLYAAGGGGLFLQLDVVNRGVVLLDANVSVGPGRKLVNEGLISMRSRGTLQSSSTAALVNEPAGVIEIGTVFTAGGLDAVGINFGTITNDGTVTMAAGEIAVIGTVTSTGTWQVGTSGATPCTMPSTRATDETRLFFRSPVSLTAGSVIGPGCFESWGGDLLVEADVVLEPGALSVWGYVATIEGDRALPRTLLGSGGKLSASGTLTVPNGLGQHPNQFYRLGGTGTIVVPKGVAVDHTGNAFYVDDDVDVVMEGPFTIDGISFAVRNSASFTSTGTWTVRGNSILQADAAAEIVNTGTLVADPGAGRTLALGGARGIDNRGTFRLASGTVDMRARFRQMTDVELTGGRIEVANGATWIFWPVINRLAGQLRLEGTANVIDGFAGTNSALRQLDSITGSGRLELADGADLDLVADVANGITNGGVLTLDVGSVLTTASYAQTFSATLGIELGATGTGQVVAGPTTLGGTLQITPESIGQPSVKDVVVIDSADVRGVFASVTATDGGAVTVDDTGPVTVTYDAANSPIVVTTTADSGAGSLRQAIIDANDASGLDTISFDIPGDGPHRLDVKTALPEITGPVVIDATTEPGYDGTRPLVEVYGANLSSAGLTIRAAGSTVRGLSVTGWAAIGVRVFADDVVVEDSWIGVSPGERAVPNGSMGISGNGSRATVQRNVISGNNGSGVFWNPATDVVIRANRIGTTPDGTGALGNTDHGIVVVGSGSSAFAIGGPSETDGNQVLANGLGAILASASLSGSTVVGTLDVRNNMLGAVGLGNGTRTSPTIDVLRFDGTIEDNTITDNPTRAGILLKGPAGNVRVRRNVIARNAQLGINLSANPNVIDGVTPNDAVDADVGVNGIQNFPVLTAATRETARTTVAGTIASKPSTTYTIDVYANTACDTSGNGEAESWLGSVDVTTDGSGRATFGVDLPPTSLPVLTATATGAEGTSELSACRTATASDITFTADDATANEADGAAVVTVRASAPVPADTTVYLGLSDGTATRDLDFATRDETVVIPAGQTSALATVSILDDDIWEESETFELLVLRAEPIAIVDRATVTIVDDDPLPAVEIAAFNPYREDSGTISLPVRLARTAGADLTFEVQAWSGTADVGEDFRLLDTTVTIPAGTTGAFARVEIVQDSEAYEADREFFGVSVARDDVFLDLVEVEIEDDDPYIQARFVRQHGDDPDEPIRRRLVEGDALDTTMILPVEVTGWPSSGLSTDTVTVELVVDSAVAERGVDFDVSPSQLTFGPGDGPKSFTVTALADLEVELDELLLLGLQTPQGDLLGRADDTGTLTIVDDDQGIVLTASAPLEVGEGDGQVTVTISAAPAPAEPITLPVTIEEGTASLTDDLDLAGVPATVTIPAGATSVQVGIPIVDDALGEGAESFEVVLGPANQGSLFADRRTVSIVDDDPAAITLSSVRVDEAAGFAQLTVAVDTPLASNLLVPFNFVPVSTGMVNATYDIDYDGRPGSVVIPAGSTSATIPVPIVDDAIHEADEGFVVVAYTGDGGSARGRVTITDDDPPPAVTIEAFGPYAEDSGSISLPVRLARTAGTPLTFDVVGASGTAELLDDFRILTPTVTIPAGVTEVLARVEIVDDDDAYELDRELFAVTVERAGEILAVADVEIVDDDTGPQARFVRQPTDAPNRVVRRALVEGTTDDVTLPLRVELLGDPITEPTVVGITADSFDAERFVDFDVSPNSLTFQPGDGQRTVTVTILADSEVESDETILLGLSTEFGDLLGRVDDGAEITILDDDGDAEVDPAVDAFRAGWADLLAGFDGWLAGFDLPALQAPAVVTPSLAAHFGLPDLELGLPTIDPNVDTLSQLIADLQASGFAIDFADGGLLGHPVPPGTGDVLQARIEVNLPDLARVAGFTLDPYHDGTDGVLGSLATAIGLDAEAGQGWTGDLTVGLVVGVDAGGFYVDDGTDLSLDVGGLVDLAGTGTVGGFPTLPVGVAAPDLTVSFRPGVLRLRDLDLPLLPSVTGTADLSLALDAGPFSIDWDGSWTMGPSGTEIETPTIDGSLTLPGLDTCDPLAPADLAVTSELLADRWLLTAEGPVSECYLFGGFEAGDVAFTAEVGPDALAGSGALTLTAPVPGGDRTLALTAAFDPTELTVGGSLNLPQIDLGDVVLSDVTIGASFTSALPGGPLTGDVTVSAASADLLDGVGTATDLVGTLTSDGDLVLRAATVAASIEGAIDLALTDVELSFGPGAGSDLFRVDAATGTFPALDDLRVTFAGLFLSRAGMFGASGIDVESRGLAQSIGLSGILPFDVTEVTVVFPTPSDLSTFLVSVVGRFDFGAFPPGLTPRVGLGGAVVTPSSPPEENRFTFSVAVDALEAGEIRPIDLGPFTLGFDGLPAGDHSLGAELTLDGYAAGVLQTGVSGRITVAGPADSLLTGAEVVVAGDLVPGDPTLLDLQGTTTFSGNLPGGVEVTALELVAGVQIAFGTAGLTIGPRLESARVGEVLVPFGDLMTITASAVELDFAPSPGGDVLVLPADGDFQVRFDGAFPALDGWGGSARGVALDDEWRPRLLEGFGIDIDTPTDERLGFPSWLPFSMSSVGVTFPDLVTDTGELAIPPGGVTLTPELLQGLRLRVSGGLTATDTWPISAGVDDLEVDLGLLADRQFPITNLNGVRFGVEPFELPGGVVIGGGLQLGTIDLTTGERVFYGRVVGEFAVAEIGGGADLIVSQYGPVLMKVRAPLGIPLGPTGFVLAGAEGAAQFGSNGVPVPPPGDPGALLANGFDLPTDVALTPTAIEAAVLRSVQPPCSPAPCTAPPPQYTWENGFALALAGDLITLAAPGVVKGRVSVGFNLGLPEGPTDPPGLQLVGKGDVTAYGIPLGEVGLLVDFDDPIEPSFDLAFASPVPGSPLALIVPAVGTLGVQLRTDGVALGTIEGLRVFVEQVADGTLAEGGDLFETVLDEIAARLQAERSRPLARLLLDGDEARTITPDFLVDRLLGRNGLAALLPATVDASAEERVARAANAVLNEILLTAGTVLDDPATFGSYVLDPAAGGAGFEGLTGPSGDALAAMAGVVRDATADGLAAFGDRFDPSFTMEGALQSTILGLAIGDPAVQGTLSIDRDGVFFELGGSVVDATQLTLAQVFPPLAPAIELALSAGTLGITDQLAVGLRLPVGGVVDSLLGGSQLPQFEPLDPDWSVTVEGALGVLGFEVAELSGLAVLPDQATFLETRVQIYDDPGDWVDRNRIPVTQQRFDDLVRFGGLLVTGSVRVPQLVTRPGDLLAAAPAPPNDPLQYLAWLQDLAELGSSVDTPARVQLFLPGVGALADEQAALAAAQAVSLEGVWNGDVLGLDLGAGSVELTPDGLSVSGGLPLSGGTVTATMRTRALDALSDPATCPVPPDGLPCLPMAGLDAQLTNAEVVETLTNLGVPDVLVPRTGGRLRAYTPGFDDDSSDRLLRNGGVEVGATVEAPGLLGPTGFTFALTPRTGGFDVRGSAFASQIGPIAGLTINAATVTVDVVDGVASLGISGTARVFGAEATVDGQLAGDLTGTLQLRFTSGSRPIDLGGLQVIGTAVLTLARDASGQLRGSVGVLGRATLPAWMAAAAGTPTANVGACIDTDGNVEARLALPALLVGPRQSVRIGRNPSQAALPTGPAACTLPTGTPSQPADGPLFALRVKGGVPTAVLDGSLELLNPGAAIAGLSVRGELDGTTGTGSLAVAFAGGTMNLGGFAIGGSATATIGTSSFSMDVDGTVSVAGLLDRATVRGDGDETGISVLAVTGANLTLPVVTVDQATLELRRAAGTYRLHATARVDIPMVANDLTVDGSFTSNGNGTLAISATSLTVNGAAITDGSFALAKTGSTIALRAAGRFTLFGVGLEVVQANLALAPTTITGSLTLRPVGGASLSLGGWGIGGTLRLVFSGTSVTVEIDDGSVTVPGWGSVGMDGSISVPPVNGSSFTLSLPSGGLPLGPPGTPFFGTGTYRLAFSNGVGAISVTNGGLQWRSGGTVLASASVPSLTIATNGAVSAALESFSAKSGGFAFTVPSLEMLIDPSGLNARLALGVGTVVVPGIAVIETPGFSIGTSSTFSIVLVDDELDLGLWTLTGRVTFQRQDGVFRLRLDDKRNAANLPVEAPRFDLDGLVSVPLPTFFVASNGTFAVDADVPTFGPSGFQVVGASLSLSKTGASITTLAGELTGGQLLIGNADPLPLPGLSFDFNSRFDETFEVPGWGLGPFLRTDDIELRVRHASDGTIRLTVLNSPEITALAGSTTLALDQLDARSDGTFEGTVTGRLTLFGTRLVSATFDLSRDGSRFRLSLPSSRRTEIDLGFLEADVSGFARSDGSFSFTGNASVYLGVTGFSISGTTGVTLASGSGITGSFSGTVCFVVCGTSSGSLRSDGRIRGFLRVDSNGDGDYDDRFEVNAEYRVYLANGAVLVDGNRDGNWDFGVGTPTDADTTKPSMTTPPSITVNAAIGSGGRVRVYYSLPSAFDGDLPLTVRCTPPSGSEFGVGETVVTCTATDDGGNIRERSFTVTVVADPAAPVPVATNGATVVVVADGFAPGSWVNVRFQSDPIVIGTYQADAAGRIELTLTVPEGLPPGEHDVIVEGFAPDGSVRQFVQPIIIGDAATPTTGPLAPILPRTGSDPTSMSVAAVLLVVAGAVALLLGRPRRRPLPDLRRFVRR